MLAEFLSPTSVRADTVQKPARDAELGVRECFLFDPDGAYRVPQVQGWTLQQDGTRMPRPARDDGSGASRVVPVRFIVADGRLGLADARIRRLALRYDEAMRRLREEEAARQHADEARQQAVRLQAVAEAASSARPRRDAEAEAARLRADLNRLRRDREG